MNVFARKLRGFTLIEMLIAVAVFSILSVTSVVLMNEVLQSRQAVESNLDRLAEIQKSMLFLGRDLQQAVDRKIRDEFGDTQDALKGDNNNAISSDLIIELTRGGYPNPLGAARSNLQRVAYRVKDNTLYRITWPVLDRAQDTKPFEAPMCTNVTAIRFRYLGQSGEWSERWPVQAGAAAAALPKAIELTLELDDWGEITKLVGLAGKAK